MSFSFFFFSKFNAALYIPCIEEQPSVQSFPSLAVLLGSDFNTKEISFWADHQLSIGEQKYPFWKQSDSPINRMKIYRLAGF